MEIMKTVQFQEFPKSVILSDDQVYDWAYAGGHKRVELVLKALKQFPDGFFYNHIGDISAPTGFRFGVKPWEYISEVFLW
jgi:hypothetical protein